MALWIFYCLLLNNLAHHLHNILKESGLWGARSLTTSQYHVSQSMHSTADLIWNNCISLYSKLPNVEWGRAAGTESCQMFGQLSGWLVEERKWYHRRSCRCYTQIRSDVTPAVVVARVASISVKPACVKCVMVCLCPYLCLCVHVCVQ